MAPTKQQASKLNARVKGNKKLKAALAASLRWNRPNSLVCTNATNNPGSSNSQNSSAKPLSVPTARVSDIVNNSCRPTEDIEENINVESTNQYALIDVRRVESLIGNLACPQCFKPNLALNVSNQSGFAAKLSVSCTNCDELAVSCFTSEKIDDTQNFDVNRRVVKAFTTLGKGYTALEQFCLVMNMPVMSSNTFNKHATVVANTTIDICFSNLEIARKRVREIYRAMDCTITEDSVIDLGVSYDGSWHKRGHTSNYGIGCVIELQTGLVLDYCVLSKYCHVCAVTKTELGEDSPEFDIWYSGHKDRCYKNYNGSSPAMETKAAEILWQRSSRYNFRYVTILSDGDSSVFGHLQGLNVYGADVTLEKEECVNHVAKRLGTALRNVVKTCRAQKITIGGRGFGMLKETTIVKLTKYYKNSILRHLDDVSKMKNDILATLHHCVSTDEVPRHTKCPTGDKSWCFYNRALAKGDTPGLHNKENMGTAITPTVLKHIFPVYQRLVARELLERCVRGRTQNANESLHGVIWKKCPKTRNISKKTLEAAVAEAVSQFNFGNSVFSLSMNAAGVSPGRLSGKIMKIKDKKRSQHTIRKNSATYKRYRRQLKLKKQKLENKKKKKEGLTYGAGQF